MYNHRSKGGTENNPYPSDFFDCSSYTLAHQKRTSACFGHYISTKALRTLILDTIRTVSTFAISNQEVFMEKVRSASQLRQTEAAKDAKRKLSKDKKRIADKFDASCCEMEGAAIAQVCWLNRVPFAIVRAISDKADGTDYIDYPTFEAQAARQCAALVTRMMGRLV